jgi:hypothetical protein
VHGIRRMCAVMVGIDRERIEATYTIIEPYIRV